MATLQATQQWSASTAKTRLKHVTRERPVQPAPEPDHDAAEALAAPTIVSSSTARAYHGRLSELEQRQLLLQTVTTYSGWHLISVQHRPESDVLVAYLVRSYDNNDPVMAIREGRALQIIMDAVGDLKVQHPRRKREGILGRLLKMLVANFGLYPTTR